jgi:hypothetical protein
MRLSVETLRQVVKRDCGADPLTWPVEPSIQPVDEGRNLVEAVEPDRPVVAVDN